MSLTVRRGSWPVLVAGIVTWLSAVGGRWYLEWGAALPLTMGALALLLRRHRQLLAVIALVAAAGWWAGMSASQREMAVLDFESPSGPVALQVRLLDDVRRGEHGWWVLAVPDPPEPRRPPAVPMLLALEEDSAAGAGEHVWVEGRRSSRVGTAGGEPYAGVVNVGRAIPVEVPLPPWWSAGNTVRHRALQHLDDHGPRRALLAGFLVGHTQDVPAADLEAMRLSGLSHLVAVSGSNVSLFLMMTLVAAGPLASGPRRRALVGLVALVVLVVATRWEPSVLRASIMTGLMLAGRIGGWALDAASALAVTVIGVVVVAGDLATDVGFALSVLATGGVIAGSNLRIRGVPRWATTTLGATVSAQLAVSPLLLTVFGSLPVMAPLTNLVAVPVVAATTMLGAVAVAVAWEPLISVASAGAAVVLWVARLGAGWPQVSWGGLAAVLIALGLAVLPRLRPAVAVASAVWLAAALMGGSGELPRPGAVVLDVGQGDAILVASGGGRTMLVDGGPDPVVLEAKLSHYGVASLDLVVVTHVHADHAAGLSAVVGRRPIGEMWMPANHHRTPASEALARDVAAAGVSTRPAPVGQTLRWEDLKIEVLAPLRRYASPNDESVVLRVGVDGGPSLLLTGDIETHAQADLAGLEAEILKVPHQGAATSDLGWLESVGAGWAVVSVGPNDFGHPDEEVLATLRTNGATVTRTDQAGDVVVPLTPRR